MASSSSSSPADEEGAMAMETGSPVAARAAKDALLRDYKEWRKDKDRKGKEILLKEVGKDVSFLLFLLCC